LLKKLLLLLLLLLLLPLHREFKKRRQYTVARNFAKC